LANFLVDSPEVTKDIRGRATVLAVFGNEDDLDNIMGRLRPY
jgi:hypothetical protein